VGRRRQESAVPGLDGVCEEKGAAGGKNDKEGSPTHAEGHRIRFRPVESRSRVVLPGHVRPPFEVFVNGVPQSEGTDYELIGNTLLFARPLAREGKLGFWRWLSMLLGIAGTYRKHDAVTVVYSYDGRRLVANLTAVTADAGEGRA
jgi:hypothetical protein